MHYMATRLTELIGSSTETAGMARPLYPVRWHPSRKRGLRRGRAEPIQVFGRLGAWCCRRRRRVVALWFLAACYYKIAATTAVFCIVQKSRAVNPPIAQSR